MGETEPGPSRARSGLAFVLAATVVAGGLGYLIQGLVPIFIGAAEYVTFSVFWATLYLIVSALSGAQQETSRAVQPVEPRAHSDGSVLRRFAFVVAIVATIAVGATAPLWAPDAFRDDWVPLTVSLLVGVVGYTLVAVLSGVLYGVRAWPAIAALTVADAGLRVIAIVAVLLVGGGIQALAWAVATPFSVAFLGVWILMWRRLRRGFAVDVALVRLLRNATSTVAAALCTGLLISGLPLVLSLTLSSAPTSLLASLILVITLTRAPLVIPLLALQSYLVVTFRDAPEKAGGRLARWGLGLAAATLALAALAALVGPWVLDVVYAGKYELPGVVIAVIVASAGLTAGLCLTGPALIAASRHGAYVLGWAAASIGVIGLLLVPLPPVEATLVALVLAPMVGVAIHVAALRRGPGV
jgi:O-antigen/teichoic acid export membrane protein